MRPPRCSFKQPLFFSTAYTMASGFGFQAFVRGLPQRGLLMGGGTRISAMPQEYRPSPVRRDSRQPRSSLGRTLSPNRQATRLISGIQRLSRLVCRLPIATAPTSDAQRISRNIDHPSVSAIIRDAPTQSNGSDVLNLRTWLGQIE